MRVRAARTARPASARDRASLSSSLRLDTPADLRQLQHAIGNRGVRRVLARYRLSPDAVMGAVERIPFMKGKLAGQLRGEDMKAQVKRQVDAYNEMFESRHGGRTNTGVMLAIALNGVARMIAEELVDPGIQPRIAHHLFDLYQQEIQTQTGLGGVGDKRGTEALATTRGLLADDPLGLYMHGELRVAAAAERVRKMATAMGKRPADMYELLRHKWEAEMAAYTKKGLTDAEPTGAYNVKETTGELSGAYFEKLFGKVAAPPRKHGGGGLVFGKDAEDRLGALLAEVTTPSAAVDEAAFAPRHAGMTNKQERHLTEIERAEKPGVIQGARDALAVHIAKELGLARAEADALTRTIETWLKTVPLTITVEGQRWFGAGAPKDDKTKFKPATETPKKTAQVAEVFGKADAIGTIEHAGKYDDAMHAAERGEKYLRFRRWKDELMTGLLGMGASEMPTFGAANVNWARMYGSMEHQRADTGETKGAGVGYYGDVHFLLKEEVRNRLVYTATDHGPPRREPLLALLDFVTGTNLTGLLGKRNMTMLYEVINAAKTRSMNIAANLPFELQIFGGIDLTRDVRKILYAPSVGGSVKMGIAIFCHAHPDVRKEEITSVGDKSTVISTSAIGANREMQMAVRKELLKPTSSKKDLQRLEGLTGAVRDETVKALNLMRMDLSNDEDAALAAKLAAEVLQDQVEPHIRKAFLKYKKKLVSIG